MSHGLRDAPLARPSRPPLSPAPLARPLAVVAAFAFASLSLTLLEEQAVAPLHVVVFLDAVLLPSVLRSAGQRKRWRCFARCAPALPLLLPLSLGAAMK
jgi:hypothetical protein